MKHCYVWLYDMLGRVHCLVRQTESGWNFDSVRQGMLSATPLLKQKRMSDQEGQWTIVAYSVMWVRYRLSCN